ncbi:MAG: hypothetical protein PHW65_00925 [Dehalococcoidales bacterium]|nr:hypothetical protein [Dehalococcoidales bacterium]
MKRDIDIQKIPAALDASAKQAVNKGLPFGNRTLNEIEAKDMRIYEDLRKGTAHVKIYNMDEA